MSVSLFSSFPSSGAGSPLEPEASFRQRVFADSNALSHAQPGRRRPERQCRGREHPRRRVRGLHYRRHALHPLLCARGLQHRCPRRAHGPRRGRDGRPHDRYGWRSHGRRSHGGWTHRWPNGWGHGGLERPLPPSHLPHTPGDHAPLLRRVAGECLSACALACTHGTMLPQYFLRVCFIYIYANISIVIHWQNYKSIHRLTYS